jgi:hypothetical protein
MSIYHKYPDSSQPKDDATLDIAGQGVVFSLSASEKSDPEPSYPPYGYGPNASVPTRPLTREDIDNSKVGLKFSHGKPAYHLLDPLVLKAWATVMGKGAVKYSAWNYTKGIPYSQMVRAAMGHLMDFYDGQDLDPVDKGGSGDPHLWHALCEIAMLITMTTVHPELDDRPNLERKNEDITQ